MVARWLNGAPYLLLLHELCVGAIIDNVAAKDGSRQDGVDLFGIDVLELAVENKFVARGADCDGRLLAEQDKGKDVAILREKTSTCELLHGATQERNEYAYLLAIEVEKGGRVHAVGDGAADKGEPVEDHGGLILVLEEDLAGDIEDDGQADEAKEENGGLGDDALGLELVDERVVRRDLKDTHDGGRRSRFRRIGWAIESRGSSSNGIATGYFGDWYQRTTKQE